MHLLPSEEVVVVLARLHVHPMPAITVVERRRNCMRHFVTNRWVVVDVVDVLRGVFLLLRSGFSVHLSQMTLYTTDLLLDLKSCEL